MPELITSTPWSSGEGSEANSTDQQAPVPVEFLGDPRRVIGHPSNPTTGAAEAYSTHLQRVENARQAVEDSLASAVDDKIITEVPKA